MAKSAGPYVALVAGSLAVLKGLQMASDKYVEDMKEADASLANCLTHRIHIHNSLMISRTD